MRSAPPADRPAGDPDGVTLSGQPQGHAEAGRLLRHAGRRRARVWVLAGVVVLALAGGALGFALTRHHAGSNPIAHGSPSPSPVPPAEPFAFTSTKTDVIGVSAAGKASAVQLATTIQASLASFYQQAFATPSTWTRGVPASAWSVFSPAIRAQAERDSTSLALGAQARDLLRLHVTDSTLTVHVLVDASGHPVSALADVTVQATGSLKNGEIVSVTNSASLLFRRLDQAWVITGYPAANTSVTAPTPTPGPSPTTGSPSPGSPSPAPSASPS
jgi:hypothetical protein